MARFDRTLSRRPDPQRVAGKGVKAAAQGPTVHSMALKRRPERLTRPDQKD